MEASRTLLPTLLSNQTKWAGVLDVNSEGRRMFEALFSALKYFSESLRNFRGQMGGMLEFYFEPLPRRSSAAYAEAYAAYFREMSVAGRLFFPEQEFHQSVPVELCYVPAVHPAKTGGKISKDEWNAAVAKAQELVAQSERGELTDEELKRKLKEL